MSVSTDIGPSIRKATKSGVVARRPRGEGFVGFLFDSFFIPGLLLVRQFFLAGDVPLDAGDVDVEVGQDVAEGGGRAGPHHPSQPLLDRLTHPQQVHRPQVLFGRHPPGELPLRRLSPPVTGAHFKS
jgi:hypothetical protein